MKIVNRETFLTLPPHTLYATVPVTRRLDMLAVKGETIGDDWSKAYIPDWECEDSTDWHNIYESMLAGSSVPMSTEEYGRDGGFEPSERFLVFERADLLKLRDVVERAIGA